MRRLINIILISVLIIPLIFLLIYSFTYNVEWPNLNYNNLRLDALNYWLEYNYQATLGYSIALSLVVAILTIIISFPAARVLAYYDFKGKSIFRLIFFLPLIVPITAISIGVYYQFIILGLAGNSLGVIIIHLLVCAPYVIIILDSSIKRNSLKKELIARQLGATKIKTFLLISIPNNIRALILAFSLSYIISFSQYFTTFIIGQGQIKTYALEMYPYILSNNQHYGALFNLIFILSITIVLVMIVILIRLIFKYKLNYQMKGDDLNG